MYLRVIAPLAGDEQNDVAIRHARFALDLVTCVSENDLNIALTEDLCTARAVQCAAAFAASEHTSRSTRFPDGLARCEREVMPYTKRLLFMQDIHDVGDCKRSGNILFMVFEGRCAQRPLKNRELKM